MTKSELAIRQMEDWALDDSHGYDQQFRWGERGDYDCSAAVIRAWELAGVPVETNQATYTGNIYPVFTSLGFEDVTSQVDLATGAGLKRSDVMLNCRDHVAMYCGDGREVEASINENGDVVGGQPGDQTGFEFLIRSYRNYPWDCVLRFKEEVDETLEIQIGDKMYKFKDLQLGNGGNKVRLWQIILRGYKITGEDGKPLKIDGKFGANTEFATKTFQRKKKLEVTGIVNEATWKKAMKL